MGVPAWQLDCGRCKFWMVIQLSQRPPLVLTPGNGQFGAEQGGQGLSPHLLPVTEDWLSWKRLSPGGVGPPPRPPRLLLQFPSPLPVPASPASVPLPPDPWTDQARAAPPPSQPQWWGWGPWPPAQGKAHPLGSGPLSLEPALLSLLSRLWTRIHVGYGKVPPSLLLNAPTVCGVVLRCLRVSTELTRPRRRGGGSKMAGRPHSIPSCDGIMGAMCPWCPRT